MKSGFLLKPKNRTREWVQSLAQHSPPVTGIDLFHHYMVVVVSNRLESDTNIRKSFQIAKKLRINQ